MKKPTIGRGLERGIDLIGEILAFLTVGLWAVVLANSAFGFIDPGLMAFETGMTLVTLLWYIAVCATLVMLGLKGLEFALKRGWLISIIYLLLVAACIVFAFMPETITSLF